MKQYRCNSCKRETLTKDDFYFRKGKRVTPCKACKQVYQKNWNTAHPEYHRLWTSEHKSNIVEINSKHYLKRTYPKMRQLYARGFNSAVNRRGRAAQASSHKTSTEQTLDQSIVDQLLVVLN